MIWVTYVVPTNGKSFFWYWIDLKGLLHHKVLWWVLSINASLSCQRFKLCRCSCTDQPFICIYNLLHWIIANFTAVHVWYWCFLPRFSLQWWWRTRGRCHQSWHWPREPWERRWVVLLLPPPSSSSSSFLFFLSLVFHPGWRVAGAKGS